MKIYVLVIKLKNVDELIITKFNLATDLGIYLKAFNKSEIELVNTLKIDDNLHLTILD